MIAFKIYEDNANIGVKTITLYDELTNSKFNIYEKELVEMSKHIRIDNIVIDEHGKITLGDLFNTEKVFKNTEGLSDDLADILNSTIENQEKYYIMSKIVDEEGNIKFKVLKDNSLYIKDSLLHIIDGNIKGSNIYLNMLNKVDKNGDIEGIKTYTEDKIFKKNIDLEYEKFISKSKIMGLDERFEYEILGKEVIYKKYKGSSEKVIVPKFVTSIANGAIRGNVRDIKLSEGLKYIGTWAFGNTYTDDVYIPDSVEYMLWRNNMKEKSSLIVNKDTYVMKKGNRNIKYK